MIGIWKCGFASKTRDQGGDTDIGVGNRNGRSWGWRDKDRRESPRGYLSSRRGGRKRYEPAVEMARIMFMSISK